LKLKIASRGAKTALKQTLLGSFLPLALALSLTACTSSAPMDEFFIRGHFRIPTDTKLLYRFSNPGRPNIFGQRENLIVKATFEFTEEQLKKYMETCDVQNMWTKLPIADRPYVKLEETDRFHQADFKRFDSIKNGYYLCQTTTGWGLIEPRKYKKEFQWATLWYKGEPTDLPGQIAYFQCPPAEPLEDFALAVLDTDKRQLFVVLKQDY